MGLFGHDNAAVLDGGLPKWLKEGRPTQDGEPAVAMPAEFRPDYRAGQLRGVGDILRNGSSGAEQVVVELAPVDADRDRQPVGDQDDAAGPCHAFGGSLSIGTLDEAAVSELKRLPCIFTYEAFNQLAPKFGLIRDIMRAAG